MTVDAVHSTDDYFHDVLTAVAALNGAVVAINRKVDSLDARLTARIDGLVCRLDESLEAIHRRFETIEARLGRMEQRFECIDAMLGATRGGGPPAGQRTPSEQGQLMPSQAGLTATGRLYSADGRNGDRGHR